MVSDLMSFAIRLGGTIVHGSSPAGCMAALDAEKHLDAL